METVYSDLVREHALNPRNVGYLEDADGVGKSGDPRCGDFAVMTIRVRNEQIVSCKFLVRGCGAAIATCSIATEMATGKTICEAQQITDERILEALGGLPPQKVHCSNLAATALQEALVDYRAHRRVDLHNWRALYHRP